MSGVRSSLGRSRHATWFATALVASAIALPGCGAGEGKNSAAGATTTPSASTPAGEAETIVIRTRTRIPVGKILQGSVVAGAPFCPGGTFKDEHGAPEVGLVDRTITCPDGTLRVGLDPQMPVGDTQSGPWRIVGGTGAYERWKGGGQMVMRYDASDDSAHPENGRERYTGSVTR